MKEFIVAFAGKDGEVKGSFDTLAEAGCYVEDQVWIRCTIICKQQSCNRWWAWDDAQGWLYHELDRILEAKAEAEAQRVKAQAHITTASILTKISEDMPSGNIAYGLKMAEISIHQAKAALVQGRADYALLRAYLETHGNVEWPIEI